MSRFVTVTGLTLAVVFALTYAIPAAGGPQALSSADPVSLAKKALKKAKKANRTARQARTSANQALAKLDKKGGFLSGTVQTVTSPPLTIPATAISSTSVTCPAGTVVVSGGYSLVGAEASVFFDRRSGNGWSVGGDNSAPGVTTSATLTVDAQCVATGSAVTASSSARADRERDRRLLQQQRAKTR